MLKNEVVLLLGKRLNFLPNILSFEEYAAEFNNLMIKCDRAELSRQTITCSLGVLCMEISNIVQLQHYWTYNDVVKVALKVEKQQKKANESRLLFIEKGVHYNRGSTFVLKVSTSVPMLSAEEQLLNSSRMRLPCVQVTKILFLPNISNVEILVLLFMIIQPAKWRLSMKKELMVESDGEKKIMKNMWKMKKS